MLPSQSHFSKIMRNLGIKNSDHVVCYDTSPRNVFSHRVAWMFSAMGKHDVIVLDGGFEQWLALKLPVEATPSFGSDAEYTFTLQNDKLALFEEVSTSTGKF